MADLAPRPETSGLSPLLETGAALVIAHPGHELRLYGWIAQLRPRVFVLTDGSGHTQQSRLEHTTTILDRLGATKGSIYGRFSDAAIYRALLDHDFDLFTQIAVEIAETIVNEELTCVAGDASEGYNPAHDVCRLLVNAALAMARKRYDQNITNLEFMVTGQPNGRARTCTAQRVKLDQRTFEEKLATARSYPGLGDDVEDVLRKYSEQVFRTEYLYPAVDGCGHFPTNQSPPDYEKHGEQRVRDGYYEQVIRYREHILPLARKLLGESDGCSG